MFGLRNKKCFFCVFSRKNMFGVKLCIVSCVLGAQKNHFTEMVLLCTHNMCLVKQGSNFSSHTRKMRIKKANSEVVFSLLEFSRE